ncbi:MAG: MinD/ParA family protein [Chloroflexota bacterium]
METEIISFHSFRRGTGKSTLVANLAGLVAARGQRVAVVETAFHAPCMHLFFNLPEAEIGSCLNDYFTGKCQITQATYDVTDRQDQRLPGRIFLVPSSPKVTDVVRALRHPYSFEQLQQGLEMLKQVHQPDYIFLDNAAGLHEDTLLSIASCNTMLLLLRPDQQDYQGTAVTLEIAQNLSVPCPLLVMNNVPETLDRQQALRQLQEAYQCQALAILPHSERILEAASARIITLQDPKDPIVAVFKQVLDGLSHS